MEEAERTRRAEEERRRQELETKREHARINYLLGQADALRKADEIRAYVAAVRARNGTVCKPMTPTALEDWCTWALAQADRIDPVLSGAYKTLQTNQRAERMFLAMWGRKRDGAKSFA